MLDFCPVCQNCLSLRTEDGSVVQVCAVCHVKTSIPVGAWVMWETEGAGGDEASYKQYENLNVHSDPTVPTTTVSCPTCEKPRQVRYVRFSKSLRFMYACPHCEGFWVSGGSQNNLSKGK